MRHSYKYFLKLETVIKTDMPNKTALGTKINNGLTLTGIARYTVQGTIISGIIVPRAL